MTDMQVYDPEQASQYRFNPSKHLMQIKSRNGAADYLEVKYRLIWFRSLCPTGSIRTEMVHLDLDRETEEETFAWNQETRRSEKIIKRAPGIAIFRAIVDDGKGGHAEGTKCEKAASFGDFIEKAETGAIGRALAELGYGTQFVGEEFDEGHRIVDAPVENRTQQNHPAQTNNRQRSQDRKPTEAPAQALAADAPATDQQMASIRKICEHLGKKLNPEQKFTFAQAKNLIARRSQEREKQSAEAIPLDQPRKAEAVV